VDGTPFGRYRLIELLGRGGMGEVWRAHDTDTDRIVAIKVLPAHFSENEDFQRRFRREAHAAARVNSPHVIPIHYYGEIDGRLYVDMRLIEGHDLQAVLADGPLEPARAVRIIEQVALALHAAHKVGLLHRDVKPSNILLDDNDFAYLIDFGIARAADQTRLTQSGNAIGTFAYIAPERLGTRTEEDARADIYSLACVLYECLTGSPPFAGDTMAQLVAAHLHAPPPQPSRTQPNVPPLFDQVIAAGMAKDPDQRYATTVALADAAHDAITTPIPRPEAAVPAQPPTAPAPAPTAPPTIAAHQLTPPGNVWPSPAIQQRPPVEVPTQRRQPVVERPPGPTPPSRRWWRRKAVLIPAAFVVTVVAIVLAVALPATGNQPASHTAPSAASQPRQTTEPRQTASQETLPFLRLNRPTSVAVDSAGAVYVVEFMRVLALPAGSTTQTELPFTGLLDPTAVGVDRGGDVYVVDGEKHQVVRLPAGPASQSVLPFTGLTYPVGVAVDSKGTAYVTDLIGNRVVALPEGSTTQTELPFAGLDGPHGVAVDSTGTVYVADTQHDRVVALPAGSTTPNVLPFAGLNKPTGVAVDNTGTVYVVDFMHDRVVALPAGSTTPNVLPFAGLIDPEGVAVDSKGTVYVVDSGNNRVVTLSTR
jgi:serine/threonine protein kinase, bacterial